MSKSFLGALIISIAVVLFFVFFMPAYDELQMVRRMLAERKTLITDNTAAQANVQTLLKQYVANQTSIGRILLALPKNRQYDYLTLSIQTAADEAGLQLDTLSLGDVQRSAAEYQTIPITMELSGTYLDFINFLKALEQSLRLYDIAKMELTEGTASGGNVLLAIKIQLNAYSLK